MFYYLSFFACLVLATFLTYRYRSSLLARLPERARQAFPSFSQYSRLSTFEEQAEAGLSSAAFDLSDNIDDDARTGLDERGTQEIMDIMRRHSVGFDEARLIRQNETFLRNGIDPATGLPLDAKAITRLH